MGLAAHDTPSWLSVYPGAAEERQLSKRERIYGMRIALDEPHMPSRRTR